MAETGEASVGDLSGNKLYQQRARATLPILVRQAKSGQTIQYGKLANELSMANARNLNYVLGAIGNALLQLSEEWGSSVPPIQAIAVNKQTSLPGEGISWFAPDAAHFREASSRGKRLIVEAMLSEVFSYKRWDDVLAHFQLAPLPPSIEDLPEIGTVIRTGEGGEGEEHRELKEMVARSPALVGLPASFPEGQTEVPLFSGDRVDVLFTKGNDQIVVEVKPQGAQEGDLVRGIFQCVKYAAVLDAQRAVEQSDRECRAILAVGGELTSILTSVCSTLGISVVEGLAGSS